MPATDLALLLYVAGLSPTDAERIAGMPLGFVLGYVAGVRQQHCDRAEVLTDPKTPYSATGGQDDPAQPDGAGYKGPEI